MDIIIPGILHKINDAFFCFLESVDSEFKSDIFGAGKRSVMKLFCPFW